MTEDLEIEDKKDWTMKEILILTTIILMVIFFCYLMFANNSALDVIGTIIGIPIGLFLGYLMIPLMFG